MEVCNQTLISKLPEPPNLRQPSKPRFEQPSTFGYLGRLGRLGKFRRPFVLAPLPVEVLRWFDPGSQRYGPLGVPATKAV